MINPDPKKYVVIIRRGKPVLVDKQIIRWRKRNPRGPCNMTKWRKKQKKLRNIF